MTTQQQLDERKAALLRGEELQLEAVGKLLNEPVRRAPVESIYRHLVCNTVTYATGRDSLSYQLVYCTHCMLHKPVSEFVIAPADEPDEPQATTDYGQCSVCRREQGATYHTHVCE